MQRFWLRVDRRQSVCNHAHGRAPLRVFKVFYLTSCIEYFVLTR